MAYSEVVRVLRDLLRFDTTNPPGNETPCARHLARLFKKEGIPCRVIEAAPGRGNVVARLKGGSKPPLLLSAHLDVVPALGRWKHPPFKAEIHGGYIWGRGAVDMKHMAAMSAVVMLELKRRKAKLDRDLIFAGVADEEVDGTRGAGFLVEHHPHLIRAGYCLTELGGVATPMGRRVLVPVQTAQKGLLWLRLRAHGQGGHGSQPHDASPIERLARAILALSVSGRRYHLTSTTRDLLKAVESLKTGAERRAYRDLRDPKRADAALKRLPPLPRRHYSAMLYDTLTVTALKAGGSVNVIPPTAEALVDGRLLPGFSERHVLAEIRRVVGPHVEVEVIDRAPALETDHRGPLWDTIVRVMERHLPGCVVAPNMVSGMTDSKDYARLGIKTYGFAPFKLAPGEDVTDLYHAPDERISIAGLEEGLRWLTDVVAEFCGAA